MENEHNKLQENESSVSKASIQAVSSKSDGVFSESMKIIEPGKNCWRVERANRAAYLIDSKAYFAAFEQAVKSAKHSLIIVGWDIDSRIQLLRGNSIEKHSVLGDLLKQVAKEKPTLNVKILIWDYALIKLMEREFWPDFKLEGAENPRLQLRWDSNHPMAASHHQKVVVIDDWLAFCGGIDLSKWRWDTQGHLANDERRTDPMGNSYTPYHDVQMMVEGDIAAALGDLVRERWLRATGEALTAPPKSQLPWPERVPFQFEGIRFAISRSEPEFQERMEVREVEQLYLDAIRKAKRYIYLENQYSTSYSIGSALVNRLEEESGPEIILVTHTESDGWLEKNTMDVLRGRWIKRLQDADQYNRFRVYYPHLPGHQLQNMTVHSKLMVVDDYFMRVGSANLCNRSMGLDTECDLALEDEGDSSTRKGIVQFRNQLIGEHSGMSADEIGELIEANQSLLKTIDGLQENERSLKPLDASFPDWWDRQVPHSNVVDPEKGVDSQWFRDQLIPKSNKQSAVWISLRFILTIAILLAMAAAWRWTPLNQFTNMEIVQDSLQEMKGVSWLPVAMFAGFVLSACVGIPVTVMVAIMAIIFGPLVAFCLSYGATITSSSISFWLGNVLGKEFIEKYAGSRVRNVSQKVARQGVLFIALLRLLPIAPFTIVNTVGGASHVRFRDFFLGTVIGSVPGTVAVTFFVDQLAMAANDPKLIHFAIASAIGLAFIGFSWFFKNWVNKRQRHAGRSRLEG
ncbi:MAG: VTT domain-containing protein [SAR324 cluster bacterium]|nr:VTT domain-containing protein [SAR324 cluster bacterium]